jgi:hypothetical protein
MRQFKVAKERIIEDLRIALSKIHITTDLWSSGNNKSILGLVVHYISAKGNLIHQVLGVREVQGEHTGANQALVVQDILSDFGIVENVGYFVGDNASSNDRLCASLSECTLLITYP